MKDIQKSLMIERIKEVQRQADEIVDLLNNQRLEYSVVTAGKILAKVMLIKAISQALVSHE